MLNVMQKHSTRVAILAGSEKTQQQLSDLLEGVGLTVVARDLPNDNFLSRLETVSPDVILVDLSEASERETDVIDTLLDYDKLPILFNDSSPAGGGATVLWAKQLARKLADMASKYTAEITTTIKNKSSVKTSTEDTDTRAIPVHTAAVIADADAITQITAPTPSLEPLTEPFAEQPATPPPTHIQQTSPPTTLHEASTKAEGAAVNFWVLGASLGGPQAVRQFLAAIEADLPVAFILAQHIGGNHISLLAEQLDRVTPFKVLPGRSGYLLRHHEVVLAPADKTINITDDGYLSLLPPKPNAIYSPSIDDAMAAVAKHYGKLAGTIVFSGMGDDGAKGCEVIAAHGGIVWAQDDASCVISSMPDQARKTNTVTYSANPRTLAEKLYQYYNDNPG